MTDASNQKFYYPDGGFISFRQVKGKEPGVFYLHGTRSSINSTKATFVESFCRDKGIAFTSLNFRGHGDSSGAFIDFTISDWFNDAVSILDNKTVGKQVIVGSSMGGWIMLLLALNRPERVKGLVGISAAPDFTEMIMELLPDTMKKDLLTKGIIYTPNEYDDIGDPWTLKLLEDGKKNLVLQSKITLDAPVILLHGDKDKVVPLETALKTKDIINSPMVKLLIQKDGEHNLSRPQQLDILAKSIEEVRNYK